MDIYTCFRCKGEILVPSFNNSQKGIIKELGPIEGIKYIRENSTLSLSEAKLLRTHLNPYKGKCLICKVSDIIGENQACSNPNCKRFNLNW